MLSGGCQRNEQAPPPPAHNVDKIEAKQLDLDGIVVSFRDGGSVELHGRDRWGAPVDTTYENVTYLRDALPVLERSLTPLQASMLRAAVGQR
jgi:hypothetical protein